MERIVPMGDDALPLKNDQAVVTPQSVSSKIAAGVEAAIGRTSIIGHSTLDSIWSMTESVEFYKIRDEAVPRAPSPVIIATSLLILVGSLILFIYLAVEGTKTFTIETDIFQSAQLKPAEWDSCVPTTTLGTIWSFQTLSFQDDCYKRLHFNLQNMYFPDIATCIKTLATPEHTNGLCSADTSLSGGTLSGGMCKNTMPFYDVATYPSRKGVLAYSCNGVPMNCTQGTLFAASATQGDGATPLCPSNFLKLEFDYSMPAMPMPVPSEWKSDCLSLMTPLCRAIYASGNPYKCTRNKYQSGWDAVASAYAFTTLARELFVIAVTITFSLLFASQFYDAKNSLASSSPRRRTSIATLLRGKDVV